MQTRVLGILGLLAVFLVPPTLAAPILIEETKPVLSLPSVQSSGTSRRGGGSRPLPSVFGVREESKNGSYIRQPSSLRDFFRRGGDYATVDAMRLDRKVGVGVESFGRMGVLGLNFELNYGDFDSATAGVGGGPGYNSFGLGWKHTFPGSQLTPYMGVGFARWTGTSQGQMSGTIPGYLESKFLDDEEKASGRFGKNFLVPSVGLQFNQLHGPSSGAALYAEVLFLLETSSMKQMVTGALGALYFF